MESNGLRDVVTLKCVHHVKLHDMLILINGSEDKTARICVPHRMPWLPTFSHVALHHSWLPGHNILAIREMMQEILRHRELGESEFDKYRQFQVKSLNPKFY